MRTFDGVMNGNVSKNRNFRSIGTIRLSRVEFDGTGPRPDWTRDSRGETVPPVWRTGSGAWFHYC